MCMRLGPGKYVFEMEKQEFNVYVEIKGGQISIEDDSGNKIIVHKPTYDKMGLIMNGDFVFKNRAGDWTRKKDSKNKY